MNYFNLNLFGYRYNRIFSSESQYKCSIFSSMKGGTKVIYDNIRAICDKKNISIKQVERELGFSNSSICKWNECEPSVWKVQKVADYLGVSMEYLLSDQKEAS